MEVEKLGKRLAKVRTGMLHYTLAASLGHVEVKTVSETLALMDLDSLVQPLVDELKELEATIISDTLAKL